MEEILRYQKELDELKQGEENGSCKIKRIYEYVKSVEKSGLSSEYKKVFIKEAKNEIPIEMLYKNFEKENSEKELVNNLILPASVIGGNFIYDVIKSAFNSLFKEMMIATKENT